MLTLRRFLRCLLVWSATFSTMRWTSGLFLLLALSGCGDPPAEPAPTGPSGRPSSDPITEPVEPYRLRIPEIDDLLAQVDQDLELLPLLEGMDQDHSRLRLERLREVLVAARQMAVEERFNQNAVTKYRILRDRYRSGGFSPIPAEQAWDAARRQAFLDEMAALERGFGEHDSDHLPWLDQGD